MLALISLAPKKRGFLRRFRRPKPDVLSGTCAGMRVLYGFAADYRESAALCRELLRRRVDRVCFADDFPYREPFYTISEPDAYALVALMLPRLTRMLSRRDGTVYFCGGASAKDAEILEILCLSNRYVLADTVATGALDRLRGASGVSVFEKPKNKHVKSARLAVFTRPPEREIELSPDCIALADRDLSLLNVRGVRRVTGVEVGCDNVVTPDGFPRRLLLAEAARRGAVGTETLSVMKILTNV